MTDFGRYQTSFLRTARLVLEPLTAAHADHLHAPFCDPELYAYLPGSPLSLEELRERYRRLEMRRSPDGSELWLNWAAQLCDGPYVGLMEATVHADATGHIAYFVFRAFQRQGFAAEGLEAVLAHLRGAVGVQEARALVDTRNDASFRLLERLGFHRVRMIKDADHFKDAPSDEHEYARELT